MKNKTNIMRNLTMGGAMFGYFALAKFQSNVQFIFILLGVLAMLWYMWESVKNEYPKIHIIFSALLLVLFLNIGMLIMAKENYYNLGQYLNYFLLTTILFFIIVLVVAAINYIKISDKKHGLWVKIFLVCFFILIIIIAIGIMNRI